MVFYHLNLNGCNCLEVIIIYPLDVGIVSILEIVDFAMLFLVDSVTVNWSTSHEALEW